MNTTKIIVVAVLWMNFLCATFAYSQGILSNTGFPDQVILNVTENLNTSMAVNWRTDESQSTSKIQWAKENSSNTIEQNCNESIAFSERLVYKDKSHYYHSFTLDKLEEGTVYVYRVGEGDKWSEWMNFKTLTQKSPALKFLYFGDVQTNIKSLWTRVANQSVKTMPDAQLIVYAGDIVNRGNNLNEWEDWFAATGNVHHGIPIMPASGNHDHGDDDQGNYVISAYWNKQFNLPLNGINSLKESSYYVNVHNVKFVVLNTELFDTDETIKKDQLKWLEDVLIANKQEWTILVMHHPIFSTKKNRDNNELRQLIKPLIDKYNVDLVLQGHDHTYARGKNNIPMEKNKVSNATYVVTVSGPKLSEVLAADWMDKSFSYTQLFHGIEVDKNKLTFSAYKVTGELADRFVLKKTKGVNTLIEQ